jgi:hypothetical protein
MEKEKKNGKKIFLVRLTVHSINSESVSVMPLIFIDYWNSNL